MHDGLHLLVLDGTLIKTGIPVLADKGYQGAKTRMVITPYKGRGKPASQNRPTAPTPTCAHPGERANAQLKSWKLLHQLRYSPSKVGHLVKAIAVLANRKAR
ncbi:transposase family protein [Actinocorallia sp. API 0066]|uniref:transposase family protein n=1 Tax=Actinocorallia sp. API 0066 TaxID=2896846 RepID=UPI0035AC1863